MVDDVKSLKGIESKGSGTDLSEFEGQKVKIESATIETVPSYYDEFGKKTKIARDAKVLKVASEVITEFTTKEGKAVPVRASEMFNLKEVDGQLGWSMSSKGKLNNFLKKLKVQSPKDLVGKTATVRIRTKDNEDGTSTDYLGFAL